MLLMSRRRKSGTLLKIGRFSPMREVFNYSVDQSTASKRYELENTYSDDSIVFHEILLRTSEETEKGKDHCCGAQHRRNRRLQTHFANARDGDYDTK